MRGQLHAPTLLPPRKDPPPQYPLGRGMSRPQNRFGRFEGDKNVLPLQEIKPRIFYPVDLGTIPTELS
jgi:hypothetical protein